MRSRNLIATFLCVVLFHASLTAKVVPVVCGAERGNVREELFLHARSLATRNKLGLKTASGPAGRDYGNIAVMYDSAGIVSRRNPFNLSSKGITFTPASEFTRYRFTTQDSAFDELAASGGARLDGLDDDDTRRVDLPFAFPFYGQSWSSLWINSDGNVTFGEGDSQPVTKTIGLLSGGPPRIAPIFADLDPSRTQGGVRFYADPAKAVITWFEVPEFGVTSRTNTIQLRIYPDGRIETAYPSVSVANGVTGIAPGRATGSTELVSFFQGSTADFSAAVAERFTSTEALDTVLLAQRFYEQHDDAYDYIAVYNNLGIFARSASVATELTVRSTWRSGFGDTVVDAGRQYGSANRLQAMLTMGPLSNYSPDPYGPVPLRGSTGDTPLSILAHEVGHLFLALASIRDEANAQARPMLTSDLAHWSAVFNAEASFIEGNRIVDRGESVTPRFESVATVERYSPLDQYLMGLRSPQEVPGTFLVRRSTRSPNSLPLKGAAFSGERQNISVEDVIAAEGRRSPDHTVAQRRFRLAVVFVVREGAEPTEAELTQLERLRSEFEPYFATAADNRAAMETSLKSNLHLSIWPAAGAVEGSTLHATISLDRARDTDLTVNLKAANGVAAIPDSIVIPAGHRSAELPIQTHATGVERITATPADEAYYATEARLQVNPLAGVKLEVLATTPDAVRIRATDANLIPYPGLRLLLSTNSGAVPGTVQTGPDGIASFRWIPGTEPSPELTATFDDGTGGVTIRPEP
ncbi:MAG: hypothetical protein JNK48_29635 [Bryobacterales bacterium]|nr:hypothetical protein [Bryobacterales bacterium]